MPSDAIFSVLEQLKPQVEQMLLLLNQKEKHVIEERFDLNNKGKKTLEEIGGFYNVTRERIRQIEKTALSKLRRNIENFVVNKLNEAAFIYLSEQGGVAKADNVVSYLISNNENYSKSSILLILSLDKRFDYFSNTIHYHPYFKLNSIETRLVDNICDATVRILKEKNQLTALKEMAGLLKEKAALSGNFDANMLAGVYEINKSFKLVDSEVGLIEWRQINPRTLRDKIYFVLRKSTKPLHFVDISNAIIKEAFDRKNVNLQAVHNELIRYEDFVLIGRGIYALKEWGYDHGTVADIITDILKEKESLAEAEIIEQVLQRRKVKPITIMLNLKNKKQFVRVGRKQYAYKKA